jgi:hypothetical protein
MTGPDKVNPTAKKALPPRQPSPEEMRQRALAHARAVASAFYSLSPDEYSELQAATAREEQLRLVELYAKRRKRPAEAQRLRDFAKMLTPAKKPKK